MNSSICTLFENHYHYGVAALINSLYFHGYRGQIFVGYKGRLPDWSAAATENLLLKWPGAVTFQAVKGIDVHFLPLDTDYHLTNYKAEFMKRLWDGPASTSHALAYFDPDIIVKCRWEFYETWMSHGVALVHEIVNNDMPSTHPIRMEWKKIVTMSNRTLQRDIQSYINGGFCGVSKQNLEFINTWADIINIAINKFNTDPKQFLSNDRTHPFWSIDQDAINIAAMCCESPVSEIGPEGMDFVGAGRTMSHATGSPKPWKKSFIWSAANANPPTRADREFWKHVEGPVKIFNSFEVQVKRTSISMAALIGRFYRRGT